MLADTSVSSSVVCCSFSKDTPHSPIAPVQDAAEVLQAASPAALVLVDELGKSTSSTDGLAFAWATAEALLATRCLTLFATHFAELARLGGMYAAVAVLHMEARNDGRCYTETHKCVAGPCEVALYGLKLARKARTCLQSACGTLTRGCAHVAAWC